LQAAYEIDQGRRNTMWASMAKAMAGDHANKARRDHAEITRARCL